jgi:Co/Zn/Cd efflux system component
MGELLNLVGLSTGIALYAMLLVMVIRAGQRPGGHQRYDPLLLATAILGLIWNVCALPRTNCQRSASKVHFHS